MGTCNSVRYHFEGVKADSCENASNCLLAPFRIGLGYKIWEANDNSLTIKIASVCMAIFAFTIWLLPTLIGLAVWKISKTHPQNCQKMEKILAQQQKILPAVVQSLMVHTPHTKTIVTQVPVTAPATVDPFVRAETIYKNLATATKADKDAMGADLEAAYTETIGVLSAMNGTFADEKPLLHKLSRILFLEAKRLWAGNMEEILTLFQGAFLLKTTKNAFKDDLNADKIFTSSSSLNSLYKRPVNSKHSFDRMSLFTSYSAKENIKWVTETFPDQIFELAEMINSIGGTYQNISKHKDNLNLLEVYFDTAKGLFQHIDTPDSRWEIACIIYNTGRPIHLLKHPGDVEGALATLKEMDPYLQAEGNSLRAQTKRAQILNICVIERAKLLPTLSPSDKSAHILSFFVDTSKALEIAEQTPGFDIFLKTLFMNNKVKWALECLKDEQAVTTMQKVGVWVEDLLDVMKQNDYDHYYHSIFACNAARYEILNNNQQKAMKYIGLAETICEKYPASSADLQKSISDVQNDYRLKFRIP